MTEIKGKMEYLKYRIHSLKYFKLNLLILTGFLICSFSIYEIKSHNAITATSMGLKGSVKLLVTNRITNIHLHGHTRCIEYSFFNKKGQLIENRFYFPRTRLVHDSELTWLTYNEEVNRKYTGLDTSYFEFHGKEIYIYNESNKKKSSIKYNANGIILFYEAYEYNDKDSLIKELYYNFDD